MATCKDFLGTSTLLDDTESDEEFLDVHVSQRDKDDLSRSKYDKLGKPVAPRNAKMDRALSQETTGSGSKAGPSRTITWDLDSSNRKLKQGVDDVHSDLDEICRRRNIPRPPRRYRSQHDHASVQNTEVQNKFGGLVREHDPIRRRQHFTEGIGQSTAELKKKNQKLTTGLQTISQNFPDSPQPNLEQPEQRNKNKISDRNPWQCISFLINEGYSIYWSIEKLKKYENLTHDQASRLYRCFISYNNKVEGNCQASSRLQATHGAAANFLEKLTKELPVLSGFRFPLKVDDEVLLKGATYNVLIEVIKEKYGDEFKLNCCMDTQEINNRKLHTCKLLLKSSKYEASSYLSARTAKLKAAKIAYEDLLKEPCPMDKIHLGVKDYQKDDLLYRLVESQIVHCYDLSRSVVMDSDAVRENLQKNKKGHKDQGPKQPRRYVQVSHVGPEKEMTLSPDKE